MIISREEMVDIVSKKVYIFKRQLVRKKGYITTISQEERVYIFKDHQSGRKGIYIQTTISQQETGPLVRQKMVYIFKRPLVSKKGYIFSNGPLVRKKGYTYSNDHQSGTKGIYIQTTINQEERVYIFKRPLVRKKAVYIFK